MHTDDLFSPVDTASAVYKGVVLTGHRHSVEAGEMFWALPGGEYADSTTLKTRAAASKAEWRVIVQPTPATLLTLQARRLKEAQS